ncbi:MAG TPA: hypothetical protein VMD79_01265 [Solirubrobacteraceae bacterium]|nr:hypothetical protein [Solirubrobacteraceae bacterium]
MLAKSKPHTQEQLTIVRWTAGLGAVTAQAFAQHMQLTLASARTRLAAAERAGLVRKTHVLVGEPALYTTTSAGLRAASVHGLEPCRVSAANAPHAIACATAAAALGCAYPDHMVMGERELRHQERQAGAPLASAKLARALHRPDLVLWPRAGAGRLPVAVEVELTVKAPARLAEICRAWARCRYVAGTLYLASEEVLRPLAKAIARAGAGARVVLVGLDALAPYEPSGGERAEHDGDQRQRAARSRASTVPGDA